MPNIEFLPSKRTIHVPVGTALLEAIRLAGIYSAVPCGGKGVCGKCRVRVVKGKVDFDGSKSAHGKAMGEGIVLACSSSVSASHVTIDIPEQFGAEVGQFTGEDMDAWDAEGAPLDPIVRKWKVNVPSPRLEDGLSDIDRLTRATCSVTGATEVTFALAAVRSAADALRTKGGEVTVTGVVDAGRICVISIEPGDTSAKLFAIAVDIGTTTVAVQLIDIPSKRVLSTQTDYNAQISCGSDVISRINYAKTAKNLEELRLHVIDTINRLVQSAADASGMDKQDISGAFISGNTVMTHLFLGIKPEYIRLEPYTPTILEPMNDISAEQVGIGIKPDAPIFMSPCVGSYVGGDITAGLLCAGQAFDTEKVSLFIDIGTNGELVIGNSEFLMACACSAGPAFEGGGILCGMRASKGAIEKVGIEPETGRSIFSTIGDVPSQGICGSGVIDLLTGLFLTGWLDRAGKLDRSRPSPYIVIDGKQARYVVATKEESQIGKAITISEKEIENVIRAKAAIYSAAALMLSHTGLSFKDLDAVYIAGGFGRFLDLGKAIAIGLIPDIPLERYKYLGNASLKGSAMLAMSGEHRKRQAELKGRMTYFELSTDPAYMHQFTGALFLPHTDLSQFPSISPPVI